MRRHRSAAAQLAEIAQVRQLQRDRAQLLAAEAAEAARSLESERRDAFGAVAGAEQDWQRAAAGSSFRIEIAAAWSSELLARQALLGEADRRLGEGRRDEADRCADLGQATIRLEIAADAAADARKVLRRCRDEHRMAEAADRAAQKGASREN